MRFETIKMMAKHVAVDWIFPRQRGRPAFMPVGTYGTVKAMTPEELQALGRKSFWGTPFI